MEESDWELNSVVAMATGENRPPVKGSSQAEKEIRYSLVSCSVVEMPIIQLKSILSAVSVHVHVRTKYSTVVCKTKLMSNNYVLLAVSFCMYM